MGKRFDSWVAEFESWGMSHDEAIAEANGYYKARFALALDEIGEALSDAAPARFVRWLVHRSFR